jgi:hypothetical protein
LQNTGTQPFRLVEIAFAERNAGLALQARQIGYARGAMFPFCGQLRSSENAAYRHSNQSRAPEDIMSGII